MSENKQTDFYHYGRLGMKWYQHIFGKEQSQAQYAKKSGEGSKSKDYKKMSDPELQKEVNRLRLENQYVEETRKQNTPSPVKKFLFDAAKQAGLRFLNAYMGKLGERLGSIGFDDFSDPILSSGPGSKPNSGSGSKTETSSGTTSGSTQNTKTNKDKKPKMPKQPKASKSSKETEKRGQDYVIGLLPGAIGDIYLDPDDYKIT